LQAYYLPQAPYQKTWELQERLRNRVLAGGPEVLLLCEHSPVLTLGRRTTAADVLADARTLSGGGVESVRTNRGGLATYHGPGQLVVYPIVRLKHGIVAHVEWLAAAAIEVAATLKVHAEYNRQPVGVFVEKKKLAAIGVHVSHRVAIHGLALNVTRTATAAFARGWFVPCGQAAVQAISLEEAEATGPGAAERKTLTVESLALPMAEALCRRAGLPPPHLQRLLSPDLFVE
jgi:lipoate-protein ligase B